jgi:hypothetical protein
LNLIYPIFIFRMKPAYPFLTLALLLSSLILSAQNAIRLKNGTIYPETNITEAFIRQFNTSARAKADTSYILLHFKEIPSQQQRYILRQAGINLLRYIPSNTFTAQVLKPLDASFMRSTGLISVIELKPEHKISSTLLSTQKNSQPLEVLVTFFETVSYESGVAALARRGFSANRFENSSLSVAQVKLPGNKLAALAALSFIQSVELLPPPPTQLNFRARASSRSNILQSGLPGALHLDGGGVKIAISEVWPGTPRHIDYIDRQALWSDEMPDAHAHHVHGIAGGAGLVNELYTGHAPGATIYATGSHEAQNEISIRRDGYMISSNSYGSGSICRSEVYNFNQYEIDFLSRQYDYLLHVFACGNSGNVTCAPFPHGFGTIFSDDQSAKTVLSVGSALPDRSVSPGSSKGPTAGRLIKPEIIAPGNTIFSTIGVSDYGRNSGTSMAAPAVSGGLALLYQRYRQLHNGVNPKNSLMKAIVCNTATDMGNKGADYSYGFGCLNMLRAVQVVDNHTYFNDSVANQSLKAHTITVPAGAAHLKVMLYWPDPPADILAGKVLVHDLDLQLTTPASSVVLPYVPDTLPANVANPATQGEDHINNIEQVIIDNPQEGIYTVKVKGTEIAQNPMQEYVIVYDIVPNDVQLTFPYGGEGLNPEEDIVIQWDAAGETTSTFKLEFSSDSGATWKNINTNIAAELRQYVWQLPFVVTNKAMIKLTRNSDGRTSVSRPFVMVRQPVVSLSPSQCPGYIGLQWPAVTGATDYEVMMVQHGKMVTVDSTIATNYIIKNLEQKEYWVTVRSRVNGKPGRRAIAIARNPNNGDCAGNISDNDLRPTLVSAPVFGRILTSDSLSVEEPIQVRLKNFDDQAITAYEIKYSVNNSAWVTENGNTTIAAQSELIHTFATVYDFSQPGEYEIKVVVKSAGDDNPVNDTLSRKIRNVTNPVLDLSEPVLDTFGLCPLANFTNAEGAWPGASRFDYHVQSGTGNLLIADKAVSETGGKGFSMRQSHNGIHAVSATYNLSAYDTGQNDIALSFRYSKPATATLGNDKLWVRGNDKEAWIELINLDTAVNVGIGNKWVRGLSISGALKAANQNFSTSTQLRWLQEFSPGQYSFDSIALYLANNDLELVSIDSFSNHYCNLGNAVPIHIAARNWTANILTNVEAKYRIDDGNIISQTIPFIDRGSTIAITFTTTANLSAIGEHKIEAWLDMPDDKFPVNNRKTIYVRNKGLFNVSPSYLENFEQSGIGWYTEGLNNSWQTGMPASVKINTAASGIKAWKTNLSGNQNDSERSYLYSPCFDLSSLDRAAISFSMSLFHDSCRLFCDQARLHYSLNGTTWFGAGNMNSKNFKQWQSFTVMIPDSVKQVQFRFFAGTDGLRNYEGLAIDDVHVYDSTLDIYDLPQNSEPITEPVTGNDWTSFRQNGKIIAAINANGQRPGPTTVRTYLRNSAGDLHGQYYLGRSFTIQSTGNALNDSVTIRLYFLNSETETLMFAENCNACLRPLHAYRLGISVYSTERLSEINGSLSDNIYGDWSFVPYQRIKIIPYLKGYYAEFKVNNFSELWLSNGGYDNDSPLPVRIPEFNATLLPLGNVELKWTTAAEINISHFEIEVAQGNEAYANDLFEKQGKINSKGASTNAQQYIFLTDAANKTGVNYYRLKVVDASGNYTYTKARPVVFSNELKWTIAPNHSSGLYNLIFQANQGEKLNIEIFNSIGSLVKKEQFNGTGFIAQHPIDLQRSSYAKGIYLVRVQSKAGTRTFRIVKK